jgi:hypothetical protein
VPDKRRDSKDRRAARNKAQRGAVAARRENAAATPAPSKGSSARSSSAKSSPARGSASGGRGSAGGRGARGARPVAVAEPPAPGGLLGQIRNPRPGDWAVLIAFALAIVAGIATLFFLKVPVDDRGNPLPRTFGGVALMARSTQLGHDVASQRQTYLAAYGAQALVLIVLPIAVVGFAVWANRRPDRSRLLTYAMIGLGAAVILQVGSPLFILPFMALLVAGFKARRADIVPLDERGTAPAPGRKGRGGRQVIDVEATDDGDGATGGVDSDDPLERLEAEMEAERTDDPGDEAEADGEPNGSGGGRKRRR